MRFLGIGVRSSRRHLGQCLFSSSENACRQRPARVVVVGSGRMGHIRSGLLRSNPKFELVGIVDKELEGAEKLAGNFGVRMFEKTGLRLFVTNFATYDVFFQMMPL